MERYLIQNQWSRVLTGERGIETDETDVISDWDEKKDWNRSDDEHF